MRLRFIAISFLFILLAIAGCGEKGDTDKATLVLDFTPNAVHSGIYTALHRDMYEDLGVDLKVKAPSSSADSLKLVAAGRSQFAIADIHDLGIALERKLDLVAVMAIVEQPLSSIIALKKSGIESPKQLAGKKVGVTGVPSDDAVLNSIVSHSGADPKDVKKITIGFKAPASLISEKVSAATAFWNAEGVSLRNRGFKVIEFRVDDYGAPSYPELVLVASRKTVEEKPELVRSVVEATVQGYERTLSDPKGSLDDLVSEVPGLDKRLMRKQLDALLDVFKGSARSVGYLDPEVIKAWADWDLRFGILKKKPPLSEAFTNAYLPE